MTSPEQRCAPVLNFTGTEVGDSKGGAGKVQGGTPSCVKQDARSNVNGRECASDSATLAQFYV